MAENMNTVCFVGTVAEDFEARTSQSGSVWGKLKLFCDISKGKDKEPERVPIEITCFGHMANSIAAHVKPGMVMLAHCDLRASIFEAKNGTSYPRLELSLASYGLRPKQQAESKPSTKWKGRDIPPPDDSEPPPF